MWFWGVLEADRFFFLRGGGGVACGSFLGGFGVVLGLIGRFFLIAGGFKPLCSPAPN